MSGKSRASVEVDKLATKELHDLILTVPVKDGFCRFYGAYVAVGSEACFPDGQVYKCVATETFAPTGEDC